MSLCDTENADCVATAIGYCCVETHFRSFVLGFVFVSFVGAGEIELFVLIERCEMEGFTIL